MNVEYEKAVESLKNGGVEQFEETYTAFSRLLLTKINNEKICLVHSDSENLEMVERYIACNGLDVEQKILISNLDNPLSELNQYVAIQKAKKDGMIVFSLIRFEYAWWNQRYPRKIDYWINRGRYSVCKNALNQVIYFQPIYFRKRGHEIYRYWLEHNDEFKNLFEQLADEESKKTLIEILRVSVNNSVWSLPQGKQIDKYWECYQHLNDECWVNCGSATGDTIVKYIYSGYDFEKIYAYEGDKKIFEDLKYIVDSMPDKYSSKIEMINQFLGTENNKGNFNEAFANKRVTLINMDIEGAEMPVLRGAREIIKKQRPVLAVCAYHKASDLIEIPAYIKNVADDYFFYLRKYIGYEPGALNEYLYYCVPKERIVQEEI